MLGLELEQSLMQRLTIGDKVCLDRVGATGVRAHRVHWQAFDAEYDRHVSSIGHLHDQVANITVIMEEMSCTLMRPNERSGEDTLLTNSRENIFSRIFSQ